MKKLDYIDAIRGYAILGVIAVHCGQQVERIPYPFSMLSELGQFGVQLFFVASALTLCLSTSRRTRFEHNPIANFYTRRYFRIAPMYYVGLLLYFVLRGFREGSFPPHDYNALTILTNLTFTHGWSTETINYVVPGGWSIAVECTFYAFFPFLFKWLSTLIRSIGGTLAALGLSYLAVFISTGLFEVENNSFRYFWFFTQLPVFMLGIVLFHLQNEMERRKMFTNNPLTHLAFLLGCGVLFVSGIFSTRVSELGTPFVFGLSFVCLTLSLASWHNPLIVNPIVIGLGKLSYSLYLVHFTFAWYVIPWLAGELNGGLSPLTQFLLSMLATTLLATSVSFVTYHFVELKFMKWGKSVISRRELRSQHAVGS